MLITPRRVLLWAVLLALAFLPTVVGAMPVFHGARYLPYLVFIFSVYAFSFGNSKRLKQAALLLVSTFLAVAVCDLAARPLLPYLLDSRPAVGFRRPWPPQPHISRYAANVNQEVVTYGDLAAMSERKEWREERRVKFITDGFGFRNDPSSHGAHERALDLIVLGDSFGASLGLTQEDLLSVQIANRYGLEVYNLSIAGHSPQQEYATLVFENDRLKPHDGSCVLWLLFAGNDLKIDYYEDLENPHSSTVGWKEWLVKSYQDFHDHSTVRSLLNRPNNAGLVIDRTFVDGRSMLFFKLYLERAARSIDDVQRHANYVRLKATFGAMKEFVTRKRLRIVVALIPSKEEVYSWVVASSAVWSSPRNQSALSTVVQELCAAQDFEYFDLKPTLIEASEKAFKESGALLWWRDDTHWNGVGQRVAADAIYEHLLRDKFPKR